MSNEVEDSQHADVAAVSAGNNYEAGNMIDVEQPPGPALT